MYKSCNFMPISTIFTALFYPYIAHERTAQTLISTVCSERSPLCLKERHRSQNEGSLKSEERLSDFIERCAQPECQTRRIISCFRTMPLDKLYLVEPYSGYLVGKCCNNDSHLTNAGYHERRQRRPSTAKALEAG